MKDYQLKGKMVELVGIYREKGKDAPEFFEQCKNFIAYVQVRFMGFVDEDLQQTIYLRLMRSFEYYDGKTNIATWIFSVARHQVSSHIYHRQKRQKESEDQLEFIEDPKDFLEVVRNKDLIEEFLEGFYDISVEPQFDMYEEMPYLSSQDVLIKALLWQRMRTTMSK